MISVNILSYKFFHIFYLVYNSILFLIKSREKISTLNQNHQILFMEPAQLKTSQDDPLRGHTS